MPQHTLTLWLTVQTRASGQWLLKENCWSLMCTDTSLNHCSFWLLSNKFAKYYEFICSYATVFLCQKSLPSLPDPDIFFLLSVRLVNMEKILRRIALDFSCLGPFSQTWHGPSSSMDLYESSPIDSSAFSPILITESCQALRQKLIFQLARFTQGKFQYVRHGVGCRLVIARLGNNSWRFGSASWGRQGPKGVQWQRLTFQCIHFLKKNQSL